MKVTAALALAASLVLAFSVSTASAEGKAKKKGLVEDMSGQGYGMAGCGLGSILFGEKPGMIQVLSSTTNGLYSNNTFGVTSGTSNCDASGDMAAQNYIETNRLAMENDVARGSGETLANFFHLVDCANPSAAGQELQKNYSRIFNKEASDAQVLQSIKGVIQENQATAGACAKLS